eukprot:gene11492-4656_t
MKDTNLRDIQVSCPGKILISGGYLILDEKYFGIVLGVSSRFHSKIKYNKIDENIVIISKQMNWKGIYKYNDDNTITQLNKLKEGENQYIYNVLYYTLNYIKLKIESIQFNNILIEIFGDDEFYSNEEGKTGLGSSACLTSSICCSLLFYFKVLNDINNENELNIINHLSQISHSKSQNKIGSGFDISTSIFGSQIYKRYSSNLIKDLIDKNKIENSINFLNLIELKWNDIHNKSLKIPNDYILLLGDINKNIGSKTPLFVKNVLNWKIKNEMESTNYFENVFKKIEKLKEIWIKNFEETKYIFIEIRKLMKEIGIKSNVQIEPDEQTQIINETLKIKGCILCGVPGAGGFDAIFSIIKKDCLNQIEQLWNKLNIKLIKLNEENIGLKIE